MRSRKENTVDTQLLSEAALDDRLKRSDPVDRTALDDENVLAALAAVRMSIGSMGDRRASLSGTRRFPVRRRAAAGFAVAVAAVASLVGVEAVGGGTAGAGMPLAVSAAAAAQLNQVARAAAGHAAPAADQWDYLALKVENVLTATAPHARVSYVVSETVQDWTRPRGPMRQRLMADGFSFLTPRDRASYRADPSAFASQIDRAVRSWDGGAHTGNYAGLIWDHLNPGAGPPATPWETSPPRTPRRLISEVWKQTIVPPPNPARVGLKADWPALLFGTLFNLLVDSTSPRLRSTAYAALAYVPGIRVLGRQKDQLGRPGTVISLKRKPSHGIPAYHSQIIVSPRTGDVLEEDAFMTRPWHGMAPGSVSQREIFLRSGIVPSCTALPGGGTQPFKPGKTARDAGTSCR